MKSFGIIGSGSWSTALAKMLTDNGHIIHWWFRNEKSIAQFKERHHNPNYLSSVSFPMNQLHLSAQLNDVLDACEQIIIGVPSAYTKDVFLKTETQQWKSKQIISAIKGILPDEHKLLHQWLIENEYTTLENCYAVTGPCHAEEVAAEKLSYLTFVGANQNKAAAIAQCFANNYIRVHASNDLWGAQLAAVLKNIYAVGAGIAHGLDYGDNFLSVYITCCYREMKAVLSAIYQKRNGNTGLPNYASSAYLGDLLVTCNSLHSRNRTFGNMIGNGYSVQAAILELKMVAEGYHASKGMNDLLQEQHLAAPIVQLVYAMLWENKNPTEAFVQMETLLV